MDGSIVALVGFVSLFALMLLRVPIGVAMLAVGAVGFASMTSLGPALKIVSYTPIGSVTDLNLGLIPMFILMGVLANTAGMSQSLFASSNAWLGHRRGGVALATVAACGLFAAISGSSVATAATMAKIALPEMKRFGYSPSMASGVVAAGGTLGILIPPSIVLVIYGIIAEQDIGRLFVAGIIPGLIAILMYMGTIVVIGRIKPSWVPSGEKYSWKERFASLGAVWPISLVFVFVIGGIFIGIFTPAEAAAMGACSVAIIGIVTRKLTMETIISSVKESLITTGGLFIIVIGSLVFARFIAITQFPNAVADTLLSLNLGRHGVLAVMVLFYLVLGFFMEAMAMILITVPIFLSTILQLGFDPIWFGIIIVMVTELALITPPFGLNVFVILGVAPELNLKTIYSGVMPFILTDILRLIILIMFPILVLYLPNQM